MNKKVLAAAGGLAAFGILTASAASLGGLTSSSVGAGNTVVASCDTDGIALSYNSTYVAASNSYNVSQVVASGISTNCNGKSFSLTLSSGSASVGGPYTGTITGTTQTITVSPSVAASSIAAAALIISG